MPEIGGETSGQFYCHADCIPPQSKPRLRVVSEKMPVGMKDGFLRQPEGVVATTHSARVMPPPLA